jgi:divalent metal cation (Fe/Co/Zn/Cd) transporter
MTTVSAPVISPARLTDGDRARLVRRGRLLSWLTLGYNSLEGVVSIVVGAMAGSVSLVGFGVDSVIEVVSGIAALWRLRADRDAARRARAEQVTLRIIGLSLLALAIYVLVEASRALYLREAPQRTIRGVVIAAASVMLMPLLARAKRRIGVALGSRALVADAMQTTLCTYLSVIVLAGLALNALFGWWWADPVAALCMVPLIAKEGTEGLRGEDHCNCT